MPKTVYRIVVDDPVSERDLMTYEELGLVTHVTDPDARRMRTGLSVFVSLAHARKKAKGLPWKGKCRIAEIVLPDATEFTLEQTGRQSSRHYTLWCDREVVRGSIARIHQVIEDAGNV